MGIRDELYVVFESLCCGWTVLSDGFLLNLNAFHKGPHSIALDQSSSGLLAFWLYFQTPYSQRPSCTCTFKLPLQSLLLIWLCFRVIVKCLAATMPPHFVASADGAQAVAQRPAVASRQSEMVKYTDPPSVQVMTCSGMFSSFAAVESSACSRSQSPRSGTPGSRYTARLNEMLKSQTQSAWYSSCIKRFLLWLAIGSPASHTILPVTTHRLTSTSIAPKSSS